MNPGEKIQNTGPSPSAFCGKKSRAQRCIICICSCALEIFSGKRARWRSQKMAYIFVQHGILPHILAYAIWNWHHKIAQLALFLHILISFFKSQLWHHQQLFWVFPENALGDGPENSRIRVNNTRRKFYFKQKNEKWLV